MDKQVIVVTSGKGGVGKTTLSAQLGISLADKGKKVIIIDADTGLQNIDMVLGVEQHVFSNLLDVMDSGGIVQEAILSVEKHKNLYILPTSQIRVKSDLEGISLKSLSEKLLKFFDFVIVDCPAGIDFGFRSSVEAASLCIIVTTQVVTAIRDAARVKELLKDINKRNTVLVVNRVREKSARIGALQDPNDIAKLLNLPLFGTVPEDDEIIYSTNCGTALDDGATSKKYFVEMADRLVNTEEGQLVAGDALYKQV